MTDIENICFLLKARKIVEQGRYSELVIADRDIQLNILFHHYQIKISQYAMAMLDKTISPLNFSVKDINSDAILFALADKFVKIGKTRDAINLFSNNLRTIGSKNKHLLLYNIAKLQEIQGNISKAIFQYQVLLKQSGIGLDLYAYNYIHLVYLTNRLSQALQISTRYLDTKHTKVEQIYVLTLFEIHRKYGKEQILKELIHKFNHKKVSTLTIYNIAIVLKQNYPDQALKIFYQLQSILNKKQNQSQCLLYVRINILKLLQTKIQIFKAEQEQNQGQEGIIFSDKRQISKLCTKCSYIYDYLIKQRQNDEQIRNKYQEFKKKTDEFEQSTQTEKQMVIKIIQNQSQQKGPIKKTLSMVMRQSLISRKQNFLKPFSLKNSVTTGFEINNNTEQIYKQKRKYNDERLKFLVEKQKKLKQFFKQVKIKKGRNKFSLDFQTDQRKERRNNGEEKSLEKLQYEKQFEEKKKKIEFNYKQEEVNEMIEKFIENWMIPKQKDDRSIVKSKNYHQKIKRFIKGIESQQSQDFKERSYEIQKKNTYKIRITKGLTSRASEVLDPTKFPGSRNQRDAIMNEVQRKQMKKKTSTQKSLKSLQKEKDRPKKERKKSRAFSIELLEGERLQGYRKFEEAHDTYARMYKTFKDEKDKQTILLKIANNFENYGYLEEAEKTYVKCTKFNNIEAFYKLGCLQIKNGDLEKGIQNLEKANCGDRFNIKIQIKLVYAYSLSDETTDRALSLANAILKRNPQSLQTLLMTSKILSKKGRIKQSLDIALAIGTTKSSSSIFHYIGLLYLHDSNVSEAYKYFQKAIEVDPSHLTSKIELATIISEVNKNEAIDILKKVIKVDPKIQLAYARLGKIYQILQQYRQALQYYKKGLQIQKIYQTHIKIGDCYQKLDGIPDAYSHYKQALNIKKTSQVYEKLGIVQELLGQQKKALDFYALAIELLRQQGNKNAKRQKEILLRMGKISTNNQQYDVAQNYLYSVLQLQQNLQIYELLGDVLFKKGEYQQAIHKFEKALTFCIDQEEKNIEILQNIAICYDKLEEFLTSMDIYEKILAIDGKNIRCLNNLSNIYLILGKTNEAFYWLEFMLQQIPNHTEKRLRVSDLYATIGDWSKVQQHLAICYKQKEHDLRVLERMVNLYKEKREMKLVNKFEKKINLIKHRKS